MKIVLHGGAAHQLATPGREADLREYVDKGWIADMKWDGVRAIAEVDPFEGSVRLVNRKGEDYAYRYPEIFTGLLDLARDLGVMLVLDGEVVIFDPATGKPQFGLTGQRALGPSRVRDIARLAVSMPATFVAFDCLQYADTDMRPLPLMSRLTVVQNTVPAGIVNHVTRTLQTEDVYALLEMVKHQRLEGIILKDPQAPYRAGRRSSWVKIKPTRSCTAIVTGYEAGEGKREATFGALHVGVLSEAGEIVPIGKVGSGFSDVDLATLDPLVRSGVEVMVEVEYLDRQPKTGVLRFPVFRGLRWDIDRAEANEAQLPPIPA